MNRTATGAYQGDNRTGNKTRQRTDTSHMIDLIYALDAWVRGVRWRPRRKLSRTGAPVPSRRRGGPADHGHSTKKEAAFRRPSSLGRKRPRRAYAGETNRPAPQQPNCAAHEMQELLCRRSRKCVGHPKHKPLRRSRGRCQTKLLGLDVTVFRCGGGPEPRRLEQSPSFQSADNGDVLLVLALRAASRVCRPYRRPDWRAGALPSPLELV